ncbi:unnamed protein product [Arctia plantaginis]|uniref:glutathione transferase n=1 Tax=Arctia plantaginis TaxID=874455 RepID=A0A8S0ZFQ0_ARCPL|nr:unnamed protein product [Arctia plantaginis]
MIFKKYAPRIPLSRHSAVRPRLAERTHACLYPYITNNAEIRVSLLQVQGTGRDTLFGSVPVLFIDGKQYAQSLAISRYLGKKYGLVGANDEENLEIDQNVDFVRDICAKAISAHYEPDEAVKEKKHKDYFKNVYPDLLAKLNALIEKNNGYLAVGKLTWEIMPKFVYHYFKSKALGEAPRLLFAYGGQEFEDVRYTDETYPAYKPNTLFGSVPVLFIDANDEENLEIDQNVDFVNDIRAKAALVHYEPDEAVKEKKHEDYFKNVYPDLLAKLNALIEKNNGYLAVGKLTWGDFVLAGMIDYLKFMMRMPGLEEKYPALKKVRANVYSIPKVKAYADAAPYSAH